MLYFFLSSLRKLFSIHTLLYYFKAYCTVYILLSLFFSSHFEFFLFLISYLDRSSFWSCLTLFISFTFTYCTFVLLLGREKRKKVVAFLFSGRMEVTYANESWESRVGMSHDHSSWMSCHLISSLPCPTEYTIFYTLSSRPQNLDPWSMIHAL